MIFELLIIFCCLPGFIRVNQVNDGVVLDFRLVLADVGRDSRCSGVVHILQGLQSDCLSRYARTVTVFRFKADVLLYRTGPGILHEITESGFGDIEALHAVIVEHRQLDFDELVADKDAGNRGTDTLLAETADRTIEVCALLQLRTAESHHPRA